MIAQNTTVAAKSLPVASVLEIGLVKLDCYEDVNGEAFFSANQLEKQLEDKVRGYRDFSKSRRLEVKLGKPFELVKVPGICCGGYVVDILKTSVEVATFYIIDVFRRNPKNKVAEALLEALSQDSLKSRVSELLGKAKPSPEERREDDKKIFKAIAPIQNRHDCTLVHLTPHQELLTSTELAGYLGLPINRKNVYSFASYMLSNGESDKLIGRRVYDRFNSHNVKAAMRYFGQKPSPLSSDEAIADFGDLM